MVSAGQEYDVTSGSEVVLDCYFHMDEYRMFDNPTVWEKTQLSERTRVNIMGVVQEPFASTRRFQVVFFENRPRYRLRLTIQGQLHCNVLHCTQQGAKRGRLTTGKVKQSVGSVCLSVCLYVCLFPLYLLNRLTFELNFCIGMWVMT